MRTEGLMSPTRKRFAGVEDIRTCVRSTLSVSTEWRAMVLSQTSPGDLVRDGTCRVCEGGYGQKEEAIYITQASISL